MSEWFRHHLIAYFDEEVGPPPPGVRERLSAELPRGRPRPGNGRRRLAAAAAAASALTAVAMLLL